MTTTEPNETIETVDGAPTVDAGTTEPTAEPDAGKGNREAAKYRTRLREVETERDGVAGQLAALRAAHAAAALAEYMDVDGQRVRPIDPADVDLGDPAALYGEDGTLNREQLAEMLTGLHAAKPYLFETAPPVNKGAIGPYIPPEGTGTVGDLLGGGATWHETLSGTQ